MVGTRCSDVHVFFPCRFDVHVLLFWVCSLILHLMLLLGLIFMFFDLVVVIWGFFFFFFFFFFFCVCLPRKFMGLKAKVCFTGDMGLGFG